MMTINRYAYTDKIGGPKTDNLPVNIDWAWSLRMWMFLVSWTNNAKTYANEVLGPRMSRVESIGHLGLLITWLSIP